MPREPKGPRVNVKVTAEPDPVTGAEPPEAADPVEAEIEQAAKVTESDLDDAVEDWRRHAPRSMRDLLDAE
jgi:hypothetical protein